MSIVNLTSLILAGIAASQTRSSAELSVIIGTVEVKGSGSATFGPAQMKAAVEDESFVRTGPGARAALTFRDGTEIYLNESTEVQLKSSRRIALKLGALYGRVTEKPNAFTVECVFAALETNGAVFAASFEKTEKKSPEIKAIGKTMTSLMVMEGKIKAGSKRHSQMVTAGYNCTMIDSQLNTPDPNANVILATRWIHPILAANGKVGPDAQSRVDACLAQLGTKEKDDPYEAALRDLGDLAARPLAGYLKYPGSPSETLRRRGAARILSDVCPADFTAGLLPLLKDADMEVKASGIRGLKRLTGKDLGDDEKGWAEHLKSGK